MKGNNDLLVLTQPEVIREIHDANTWRRAPTSSRPIPSAARRSRKPIMAWAKSFPTSIAPRRDSPAKRPARRKERNIFVAGAIGTTQSDALDFA